MSHNVLELVPSIIQDHCVTNFVICVYNVWTKCTCSSVSHKAAIFSLHQIDMFSDHTSSWYSVVYIFKDNLLGLIFSLVVASGSFRSQKLPSHLTTLISFHAARHTRWRSAWKNHWWLKIDEPWNWLRWSAVWNHCFHHLICIHKRLLLIMA